MAYAHNEFDITPQMTSNNAPSPYVVSASTEYHPTNYPAWKAFNHVNNADLNQWIATDGQSTGWLKIYFGGDSKIVKSYSMYSYTNSYKTYLPKDWTFEGSNNDSSWTTLDTRTNISWTADQTQTFSFSNSTGYKYYRINVTAINGAATLVIWELEIFELANPDNGLQKIPHSSYANRENKIELLNISSRKIIGTVGPTKYNYIGA